MSWDDVKNFVGKAAPMIGTLIGGPAGTAVGGLVSSALGTDNDPDQVMQELQANPDALLKVKRLEIEQKSELRKLSIQAEQNRLQAETVRLQETNKTMRAEIQSEDPYVRRARPTFLYVLAFSVAAEVLLALLALIIAPDQLPALKEIYIALATPQGVGLAACGIYIKKRSDDKGVAAGVPPKAGLLQTLTQKFTGGQSGTGG